MAEGIQHQQLVPGVGVPAPRGVKRESELEQPMSGGDGAESGQSKRLRTEAEADGGGMQNEPLTSSYHGYPGRDSQEVRLSNDTSEMFELDLCLYILQHNTYCI